jgi:hypothetical protein
MKKVIISSIMLMMTIAMFSQSSLINKSSQSVFKLTTFKADGSTLSSSNGVFIGSDGTAISNWTPFVGSAKAEVVDAKGNKYNVDYIIGANEIYDVAKFHVNGNVNATTIAKIGLSKDNIAWLMPYAANKATKTTISSVEKFMNKYSYYIMSSTSSDNNDGCPFINDKGEVIALLQINKTNNNVCATDAQFINDIKATGLSANDPALRQTEIRVALPEEFKQAQLALMISSQRYDSLTYVSIIHEFINKFPKYIDGYSSLAQLYLNGNDFDNAALTMDEAVKTVTNKDEAHSSYSNLIYQKELYKSNIPFAKWNLQLALDEAKAAYAVNPIPAYKHQETKILFTQGEYEKAYEGFMALTKTDIKGPELYYEAAQCKKMLKAPDTEIMTLLDSAVSTCKVPYNQMSAPYILARATQYDAMGESRKAISDYNTYEGLMQGRLNSNFYYIREQAEVKGHLFQQALNDIDNAIKLSPNEPTYYAEKASVQLRVNMLDDAISTSQSCINAYPEYADAYTILGLAQILKGNKKEGKANLEKAVQLGNKQAETLLEKYK